MLIIFVNWLSSVKQGIFLLNIHSTMLYLSSVKSLVMVKFFCLRILFCLIKATQGAKNVPTDPIFYLSGIWGTIICCPPTTFSLIISVLALAGLCYSSLALQAGAMWRGPYINYGRSIEGERGRKRPKMCGYYAHCPNAVGRGSKSPDLVKINKPKVISSIVATENYKRKGYKSLSDKKGQWLAFFSESFIHRPETDMIF